MAGESGFKRDPRLVDIRERAAKIVIENDRWGLPPLRLIEKIEAVAKYIESGEKP